MTANVRRRLVTALVACVIGWLGWLVVSGNTHSPEELAAQSRQAVQEYVPKCDDEVMSPGDTCIAWGDGADNVRGSYAERIQRFTDANQPDDFARADRRWRWFGYALFGLAALLLLAVVRRQWVVLRVPGGRRAVAQKNHWTYAGTDPMGAANAHLPGYPPAGPESADIVTGHRDGVSFQLFSYVRKGRREQQACVVFLPISLPPMSVRPGLDDPFGADTAPDTRALLVARFGVKPKDYQALEFAAEGNRLVRARSPQSSPAAMEKFVGQTVDLSKRLVTALSVESVADEPERVAAYTGPAPTPRATPIGDTEPKAPVIARAVCSVAGAAIAYGGVNLFRTGHPVWGTLVSLFAALLLFSGLAMLVSSVRVRRGRPKLAAAQTGYFHRRDADLVTRLDLPLLDAGSPGAAYLVSGSRNSRDFHVFEYADRSGTSGTAFAVRHPTAGLPLLSVRPLGDRRKESSEDGRQLLTDDMLRELDKVGAGTFYAAGDWIVGKNDDFMTPTVAGSLSRLDALARAAEVLAAASRVR